MGFAKGNPGRPASMRMNLGVGNCLRWGAEFTRRDESQVWCSRRCRRAGGYARFRAIPWKVRRRNKRERLRLMTPGPARDRDLARKREWNRMHKQYMREYSRLWRQRRKSTVVDAEYAQGRAGDVGGVPLQPGLRDAHSRLFQGVVDAPAAGPGPGA